MSIKVIEVKTKSEKKAFVNLPFTIYKNNKFWVPPLKKGELAFFEPEKNPMLADVNCKFWIVKKNGRVVGRIGAIVHHAYIKKIGQKIGRFTRAEFINDPEIVNILFQTAENWLREEGMETVSGPLGFSNLDHQGMLVEGFDQLPSMASEYHHDYYLEHLERLGYKKEMDWVEFKLNLENTVAFEKGKKFSAIVEKRYGYSVFTTSSKKELLPYARKIFIIMNDAFKDLFSVVPLSEDAIDFYVKKYFDAIDPRFVKLLMDKDGEIQGFTIGLPSMSETLQKMNGRITLPGIFHMKKSTKRPEVCDVLLTGVSPESQKKGGVALLFTALMQEMYNHGVKYIETTGMIESNNKAISHWKSFDHKQHKRKRCFTKTL